MLDIEIVSEPLVEETAADEKAVPALAIFISDPTPPLDELTARIDDQLDGQIGALLREGDFRAKRNETLVLYPSKGVAARRLILVGLGKSETLNLDVVRQGGASAAKAARKLGLTQLRMMMPEVNMDAGRVAEALVEGSLLGSYRFHELKTQLDNERHDLERIELATSDPALQEQLASGAEVGRILAESTMLARDLVNRPANIATPSYLAEAARRLATEVGLEIRVLEKPELQELGMDLFLSVNQGGNEPARMVVLAHNSDRHDLPTIVLVGKGITFDSGGLSLKRSSTISVMKVDMGGAATVFGAMRATALLDLPLHVIGVAPLTENMPDALATKPGDVVKSLKGLTVEIANTDAEGRLILADALTYAATYDPDTIIDIATLTGGRIVALGDHAAAVMGEQTLVEHLREAGDVTGERVWQLPLFEDYGEQLKSDVADVRNTGGRKASSITAAFFLSKFVPEGVPWAHIDIAGLAITDKAKTYVPKGGTGFGVRLFVEALRSWGQEKH